MGLTSRQQPNYGEKNKPTPVLFPFLNQILSTTLKPITCKNIQNLSTLNKEQNKNYVQTNIKGITYSHEYETLALIFKRILTSFSEEEGIFTIKSNITEKNIETFTYHKMLKFLLKAMPKAEKKFKTTFFQDKKQAIQNKIQELTKIISEDKKESCYHYLVTSLLKIYLYTESSTSSKATDKLTYKFCNIVEQASALLPIYQQNKHIDYPNKNIITNTILQEILVIGSHLCRKYYHQVSKNKNKTNTEKQHYQALCSKAFGVNY